MTANQLIKQLQREVFKLNTGDVPLLLEGKRLWVNTELIEHNGSYCVNLKRIR